MHGFVLVRQERLSIMLWKTLWESGAKWVKNTTLLWKSLVDFQEWISPPPISTGFQLFHPFFHRVFHNFSQDTEGRTMGFPQ